MTGILLLQLGTPDEPTFFSVRRYLHEFLMDPRVIDIPWPLRALLVYGIIGPFRSPKSAEAYAQIWTERGSPLRYLSQDLAIKIQSLTQCPTAVGMRYGQPSIETAWKQLKERGVTHIKVVPLYPQFASASYGSSLEKLWKILSQEVNTPTLSIMPPFFGEDFFIQSLKVLAEAHQIHSYDHVILSYHGLPERQILASDRDSHCLKSHDCCLKQPTPHWCYRAQCYETSRQLISSLGLNSSKVTTCFQSRLGRTPWIQPFTDKVLNDLAQTSVKQVAVLCPSFTTDCLETLEEIGIRAKTEWEEKTGGKLKLLPCLNAYDSWAKALAERINSL